MPSDHAGQGTKALLQAAAVGFAAVAVGVLGAQRRESQPSAPEAVVTAQRALPPPPPPPPRRLDEVAAEQAEQGQEPPRTLLAREEGELLEASARALPGGGIVVLDADGAVLARLSADDTSRAELAEDPFSPTKHVLILEDGRRVPVAPEDFGRGKVEYGLMYDRGDDSTPELGPPPGAEDEGGN